MKSQGSSIYYRSCERFGAQQGCWFQSDFDVMSFSGNHRLGRFMLRSYISGFRVSGLIKMRSLEPLGWLPEAYLNAQGC